MVTLLNNTSNFQEDQLSASEDCLPLVEYTLSLYDNTSLEDCLIIGVQHILKTTHTMFKSLLKRGIKAENVFLIGKCYSTSKVVYEEMLEEGFVICPSSLLFNSHLPFDEQFNNNIHTFLKKFCQSSFLSKFRKIILLDDGGELINVAENYFSSFSNIIGIEQTSSGYEKIKNLNPGFPIINLARSRAKLVYETPFIIDKTIEKLILKIKRTDICPKRILIMGNGVIGSKLFEKLKENYSVLRFDINQTKTDISISEFHLHLPKFDMLIGCTGKTSISKSQHMLLNKSSVLLSVSSSDREFDAIHLRKKVPFYHNCHNDIKIDGLTLINSGFPINFDGGRNSVAPKYIQLTRALIVASILQSCTSEFASGFIDVDDNIQVLVCSKFKKAVLSSAF